MTPQSIKMKTQLELESSHIIRLNMQKPLGVTHIEVFGGFFVGFPSRPDSRAANRHCCRGSLHPVWLTGCCSRSLPRISLMKWPHWSTIARVFSLFYIVRERTLKGDCAASFYAEALSRWQDVFALNRYIHLYLLIGATVFPVYPQAQVHPCQPVTTLSYLPLSAF